MGNKNRRQKKTIIAWLLALVMCISLLPVTTVTTKADLPPTTRTTACKEHQNWTYHSDASSHHHKYCYDCGKQFDYEECTPEYKSDGLNGHSTWCKVCKQQMTMSQPHDRLSSKTVIMNGATHTVPACSKCGYFEVDISGDGHQYELVSKQTHCRVECKLCGEPSPYAHYCTHCNTEQYNRSYHWAVCSVCGYETQHMPHVWAYKQAVDIHGNPRYDSKGEPVYVKSHCTQCGFNLENGYTRTSAKAHTHKFEKKLVGNGYHREFCTICGMTNGISKKCTNTTLTATETEHIYVCNDCGGTTRSTHIFTADKANSTDTYCAGKCTVCGYQGAYTTYWLDNNNEVKVLKSGVHTIMNETTPKANGKHATKCINCNYEIEEDCDFENDCYYTPNKVSKNSHYPTCKKCNNLSKIEYCKNFRFENYTTKTHIRICEDCDLKNIERHNMVVDQSKTTATKHTKYCDCGNGQTCGMTVTEEHKWKTVREHQVPNSVYGDGGYETVKQCSVCKTYDELTRTWHPTQYKVPEKIKVISDAGIKFRRNDYNRNRFNGSGGGGGSVGSGGGDTPRINSELFSATAYSDGILDHMGEHPEDYVDENFDLAAEVEKCKQAGTLPQEAQAHKITEEGESGNTWLVVSPMINLEVLEYDEDEHPETIRYNVTASYQLILSTTAGDGTEVVIDEKPMEVDFPVDLVVPVPVGMTNYTDTVIVTSEKDGQTYHYLGTVDTDRDGTEYTVAFLAEHGLSEFTLTSIDHQIDHREATEPTRYADGNIEYWYCSRCEKCFTDIWCTHEIAQARTVIAKYPDESYTVTYAANGGSGNMDSFTADAGTVLILPECEFTPPAGKKFDSWSEGYAGDTYTLKSDLTIYAQWIDEEAAPTDPRPCMITFDKFAEDAVGEMEPQVFQRGVEGTLNPGGFTREGYTLYGWSKTGSATNAIVDGGKATFYSDQILTAVWWKCSVISFDANAEDAQGSMPDQQVRNSVYTYLNKNTFTRDGYLFLGWSENPEATYASYKDEDYKAFSSNKTLYAIWKKQVHVSFDANAEDATGIMPDQVVTAGTFTVLKPNTFKREGYVFGGWVLTPEATYVKYADQYNYFKTDEAVTLYALWYKENTITFSANGGEGSMAPQIITTRIAATLSPNTFTREGYVFGGWATSATSKYVSYTDGQSATLYSDGDKTLYAIWNKDVTITFDPNAADVTGTMDPQLTQNGVYTQLNPVTYTREGYEFTGWAAIPEATTKSYADEYQYFKSEEDVTLYAVWHKPVTVTFEANAEEAAGTMEPQEATDKTYFKLNKNTFTREGYFFLGWARTPSERIAAYSDQFNYTYLTDDTTLYAVWYKNCTVKFNSNGGKGYMSSQTIKDRTFANLNANTFTRDGYTFVGWGLTPNTLDVSAEDEGTVYLQDNVTYYAIWKPETIDAMLETVTQVFTSLNNVDLASMTEEEKADAGEAVGKAIEALIALSDPESTQEQSISDTLMDVEEKLISLENASLLLTGSAVFAESGTGLFVDVDETMETVFENTDAIRAANALLNAFAIGVENETWTATGEDGKEKVAVTLTIGKTDETVAYAIGDAYDTASAVIFSMVIDNLITRPNSEAFYVPVIMTMPVPAALQGADKITVLRYDANGQVAEEIPARIHPEENTVSFVAKCSGDYALVRDFVAGWREEAGGFRYYDAQKNYPSNTWKRIDGAWYYFNAQGYRKTGWHKEDGKWYYLQPDGVMAAGRWKKISGKWYHFNGSGVMQIGWYKEGDVYYYLKADGSMAAGEWVENDKYYLDASGKWVKGKTKEEGTSGTWKKNTTGWWYEYPDGSYPKNQWKKIDGEWYHFNQNGYMQTGWFKEGKYYYYLKPNGAMAKDEYVGGDRYYIDANGHWVEEA